MANTLVPKFSMLRVSDQNADKAPQGVCRLLGLVTHNPDSIENLLKGDDADNGQVDTVAPTGTPIHTTQVNSDDSDYSGMGSGASFIIKWGDETFAATINAAGTGYSAMETLVFPGDLFPGGTTPANDVTVTIDTVNGGGGITGITPTGDATGVGVVQLASDDAKSNSGAGTGLVVTIRPKETGPAYEVVSVDAPGIAFAEGDVIVFSGADINGGADTTNDLTLTVTNALSQGENITVAKKLLLQKLVNIQAALTEVDPDWLSEWTDDAGEDLSYYVVPDEVQDICDQMAALDFDPDTVFEPEQDPDFLSRTAINVSNN
jgi:hypothetical protein